MGHKRRVKVYSNDLHRLFIMDQLLFVDRATDFSSQAHLIARLESSIHLYYTEYRVFCL